MVTSPVTQKTEVRFLPRPLFRFKTLGRVVQWQNSLQFAIYKILYLKNIKQQRSKSLLRLLTERSWVRVPYPALRVWISSAGRALITIGKILCFNLLERSKIRVTSHTQVRILYLPQGKLDKWISRSSHKRLYNDYSLFDILVLILQSDSQLEKARWRHHQSYRFESCSDYKR